MLLVQGPNRRQTDVLSDRLSPSADAVLLPPQTERVDLPLRTLKWGSMKGVDSGQMLGVLVSLNPLATRGRICLYSNIVTVPG